MSLLPSEPDTSDAEEADPRVIGLDSDAADEVFAALTAETARDLLAELHDEPAPPAELADRVDTSLQNAQYHLDKLESAGAIEVVDEVYSEKGREMSVYAPADRPLVIFAGDDEQSSGLRAALSRLLSSVGLLALASLAVQQAFGDGVASFLGGPGGGGGDGMSGGGSGGDDAAGGDAAVAEETATPTPTPEATPAETEAAELEAAEETATQAPAPESTPTPTEAADTATPVAAEAADAALSLPPGLLFFLGGLTALAVVAGVWYATS